MKYFIVFALVAAVALAAPPAYNGDEKHAEVIKNDYVYGITDHKAQSETSNGIVKVEEGQLTNAGTDNEAYVVRGSYSYVGADGQTYTVTYVADETGFHPEGAHLPV